MRRHVAVAGLLLAASVGPAATSASAAACAPSAYDDRVLADGPVAYWPLGIVPSGPPTVPDCAGGHTGAVVNDPHTTTLPDGELAQRFDGATQYAQVPDADDLSVTNTGILTIEAWMRPDVLQFAHQEGSGYVHWFGKGTNGQQEYVGRMYSLKNKEDRPNRISGYAYNPGGDQGAGSYFEEPVTAGRWIHYALTINTVRTSSTYPMGYVKIYENGRLRDTTTMAGEWNIVPRNGTAPFQIGTRDLKSFFEGAVGKVAVYDRELSTTELQAHTDAMVG